MVESYAMLYPAQDHRGVKIVSGTEYCMCGWDWLRVLVEADSSFVMSGIFKKRKRKKGVLVAKTS